MRKMRLLVVLLLSPVSGCTVAVSAFLEKDLYIENIHSVSNKPDAKARVEIKASRDFGRPVSRSHPQPTKPKEDKL